MLNLNTEKVMKAIPLISNLEYFILTPNYDKDLRKVVIITSITKEDEEDLDKNKVIQLVRGGKTFTIDPQTDVECYGFIDFSDDSEDMDTIADFNWLNYLIRVGVWLPSNYNYKKHCAYSDISRYRQYDTFKPELVAQYGHGCIGKPERTIIFKHSI